MKRLIALFSVSAACLAATNLCGETVALDEGDYSIWTSGGHGKAWKAATKPLRFGGATYDRGIGTCAPSLLELALDGKARTFTALAGIDDSATAAASVRFRVTGDGVVLAETPLLRTGGTNNTQRIEVDLTAVRHLKLEILNGVAGARGGNAGWANAAFDCEKGFRPKKVSTLSRQLGVLTPAVPAAPRINGPEVYGVRPSHPILYRLPVTGRAPLTIFAEGPGEGALARVTFDAATRILYGSIDEIGDHVVVFHAENAAGTTEKRVTFRVGETIALTPPLGWNSWNAFGKNVSAKDVENAAEALVKSGLADHGWAYVVIDDCWMNKPTEKEDKSIMGPGRHPDGTIVTNRRFPDMKGLVDRIHGRGLKVGLYSSPGPTTCCTHEGSWKHEWQDAKTWSDWGIDYVKYDWCGYFHVDLGAGAVRWMLPHALMGKALRHQARDIVFSICEYGEEHVSTWGAALGGQCWRTTYDVFDSWRDILESAHAQAELFLYAKPGAWNDPDMLCVGKTHWSGGSGSRLSPNEQYTQVALWALLSAPMMIGCDLTALDPFTFGLLANDEILAINQDPLGAAATTIAVKPDAWEIWARPLADGSQAVGICNLSPFEKTIPFDLTAAGLRGKWRVRDAWRQCEDGVHEGTYSTAVAGHFTHVIRLDPLPNASLKPGMTDIRENFWWRQIAAKRPLGEPVLEAAKDEGGCAGCESNRRH